MYKPVKQVFVLEKVGVFALLGPCKTLLVHVLNLVRVLNLVHVLN